MKKILLISFLIFSSRYAQSQNIDSALAVPQTLELVISTPQPRLGEAFKVTLDANYVRAHIFKSAIGKVQPAENSDVREEGLMNLTVQAVKKGKNEIGPLQFVLNGTAYTTNTIQFEVIDALPPVDNGVWIRNLWTNDSTVCIIIEQRIPANPRVTALSEKSTRYWTEPDTDKILKFKDSYSIDGLQGGTGTTYTDFRTIHNSPGEGRQYMNTYSVTFFTVTGKAKKIVIGKDKFENIPAGYKFQDIIIR